MIVPQEVPQKQIQDMIAAGEYLHIIAKRCEVPYSVVRDIAEFKKRCTYRRYYIKERPHLVGDDICECCGQREKDKLNRFLCPICYEANGGSVGDDELKVWL